MLDLDPIKRRLAERVERLMTTRADEDILDLVAEVERLRAELGDAWDEPL